MTPQQSALRDPTPHPKEAEGSCGRRDTAAVASSRAGELYGLQVLQEGIQDNKDNVTRFLVLSRDPCITAPGDARPFKTSIVFSMPERAGQLFKVGLRLRADTACHDLGNRGL